MAERVLLYGPDGAAIWPNSARLAADNLALPTAPDVLATLLGYDAAGGNLDLLRALAGYLQVELSDSSGNRPGVAPQNADGAADAQGLVVNARKQLYNSSTFDRQRNNHNVVALASAARTATVQSAELTNFNGRALVIILDVTAVAGPAGQINSIEIQEGTGTDWFTIYQFAALNYATTGVRQFCIDSGAASAASWSAAPLQGPLPRRFRAQVTHGNANSITYTLTVCIL